MDKNVPLLGILGGLGPMASVYFYELLTARTRAQKDSDHIDLLLSSRASTPDRTAYLTGASTENPAPVMCEEAKRLESAGATLLAVPCNTAHCFYEQIADAVHIPVINIIEETVKMLHRNGVERVGVLATAGTVSTGAYHTVCSKYGLSCLVPDGGDQEILNRIIYDEIKCGKTPDVAAFLRVAERLFDRGCEVAVLGCTELSLLGKRLPAGDTRFVDSLEVLAYETVLACGKEPVGFPSFFGGDV